MKRRDFLKRLSAAATAFAVTPTAFRCLPAAAKVRAVVASPNAAAQKAFVHAFFFSKPMYLADYSGNWQEIEAIPIRRYDAGSSVIIDMMSGRNSEA